MRTTIRLEESLLRQAKDHALKSGTTLTAVIEDALRVFLARRCPASRRKPLKLTTVMGKGLRPGVDLDSTTDLIDLMDGSDAAD